MRRLALIAVFLVTWKTFEAVYSTNWEKEPSVGKCELRSDRHQEEFENWFKAAARATELKSDASNFDVKLWELEEPVVKERK